MTDGDSSLPSFFVPEPDDLSGGDRVSVLLPLALDGPLEYRVADGTVLAPGDFVEVPLGRRRLVGVVWGAGGRLASERCRPAGAALGVPPMPGTLRRFVAWVGAYTMAPLGMVLRMAMSVPAVFAEKRRERVVLVKASERPAGLRMTEERKRVLDAASVPFSPADLAGLAKVGPSVVRGLVALGALETRPVADADTGADAGDASERRVDRWQGRGGPSLSPSQESAALALRQAVGGGFSVHLLDGVTGSGKTEVYFEAIAKALAQGRQVLVLLPEIALSAQWLARFGERFGETALAWHSEIAQGRRRKTWLALARGEARVVVGARSALFLPFADLGLIVVDEEHDSSFKQEDGVVYNARDMAVVRARICSIPVILASATPSLETRGNVESGRYRRHFLPSRYAGASLPRIELIDMRRERIGRGAWLSPSLAGAVDEALAAGEQALLFLNRRGYAPLTLCRACGHRLQCPHCTAWLVEHRASGRLECHHCGFAAPLPRACPACGAEGSLTACGPGVERLAEEAAARFPSARMAVMSSDTLTGPAAAAEMVERMTNRGIDLLVGTQVVAKGHHFPFLTVAGIIDADLGLSGGDLRAAERTFQLLSQVSGRAGRAERPGRVFLQTFQPEHKVMQALASGEAERFYAEEAAERRDAGMPPYGRLAALVVSSTDAALAEEGAALLARSAPRQDGVDILGPAPAPLSVLRGRHRHRFLVRASRGIALQGVIRAWLSRCKITSRLRVQIDIDPYTFA